MTTPTTGRQPANNRSLDWAIPDLALYNETSTGRARVIPRCQFCLSDSHSSHGLHLWSRWFQTQPNRQLSTKRGAIRKQVAQICHLFNQPGGSQCRFKSAGMHTYVPSATGRTQCPSVTGASPAVPGQLCLQARRRKHRLAGSRSCSTSSAAKLILSPSLLILLHLPDLIAMFLYLDFPIASSKSFHLSLL